MSLIVGIPGAGHYHYQPGIDVQFDNAARECRWKSYLAAGLGCAADEVDLALVPYAQHLQTGEPVPQGDAEDYLLDHFGDSTTEMVEQWLTALDLSLPVAQGRLTLPLHIAVTVAARRFGLDDRLMKRFTVRFFSDADRYLRERDSSARRAVRAEIGAALATHKPRVVIAHSLGAIPAYETLHDRPDLEVDCLITLGAPLAIPGAVFERLEPTPVAGVAPRPVGVRHWLNVADPGDPLTVLRPLKAYFPAVDLDVLDSIAPFDFHRARNYLKCPAVATAVSLLAGRP